MFPMVETLFAKIPREETIRYIIDQIYHKGKFQPICSELIFKRSLLKLATEFTFTINRKFCR